MIQVRIAAIKRKNQPKQPTIGDLCLKHGGLFFWSQKYIDEGYKVGSIQYDVRGVQVVDLAVITDNSTPVVGEQVVTSNYMVKTVVSVNGDTYKCKYDRTAYNSDYCHGIVALNIKSVYQRVYNHDTDDNFIGTSLKELTIKDIVNMIKRENWYLDVKAEGNGTARIENGTIIINNNL